MRLRRHLAGLVLVSGALVGLSGDELLAAPAPAAGHEQLCHQTHRSTAPPQGDEAFHALVPRAAMDQLCDPHGGHQDGS